MSLNYWNNFYKKKGQNFFWPWSDVITLINRNIKGKKKIKVLEIGIGSGANVPFYLSRNFDVFGVDRSFEAIKILRQRYPKLKKNLFSSDFIEKKIKKKNFDLIVDRGSISCGNDETNIKNILFLIDFYLKKNGHFIGVDLYSKTSTYFLNKIKKQKFKKNYFTFKSGPFSGMGKIFFFRRQDIKNFFKKFKIVDLNEKKIINFKSSKTKIFSSWMIVAQKK
jgi:cyclopropane fatty-acyl-phospholipid synthase-like methyltransferase